MTQFFMPMLPPTSTAQTKDITIRNGKPLVYEPLKLSSARKKLSANLAKHVPAKEYTGAIRLCVKWLFPSTAKHKHGEYKTTRPDTDNLQKLLKDCMTDLKFWKDDSLVCSEIVEKFYSDKPGIFIRIDEL